MLFEGSVAVEQHCASRERLRPVAPGRKT